MKLLCVKSGLIVVNQTNCYGTDLVEGQIYETKGDSYLNSREEKCYYIDGLGSKLACRFTKLLDKSESILVNKKDLCLN